MVARLTLLLIVPLLLAADVPSRPQVSRVSLSGSPQSLAAAAREVERQANIQIDLERADADRIIRTPLNDVPLWEALDRLARAADNRLAIAAQGTRIAFHRGGYREQPVSISGPFRFAVLGTVGRLNLETGIAQQEVAIGMVWEPTFKAYYVELMPNSLTAVDAMNRPLTIVKEGAARAPVGTTTPELVIKLRDVPRSLARIERLEGTVKVLGTSQMLQFSFPLAEQNPTMKRAEVTGTLSTFRKNGRVWTAVVDLEYPTDMPKLESFESFLLDNEAWLLRADGTKFALKKFELGFERQGRIPITYYVVEDAKEGPVLGDLKDWRLVVRVPGRIVEEEVHFRLMGVPLP